ncbi:hypothetical protein Bca52824_049272 [Brassica carinata]|uniref:Uncharacterized protein n=1 Tax=Brassica carinata TaxID=52824 RepID=A0A8X7RMC6_BRACI|nr:hypothetical protein Bca52824_049272 [Brassica carinata]
MGSKTVQKSYPRLHFVLFPFMAQGHMIPMVDIARLLAQRGVTITIVTTPYNAGGSACEVSISRSWHARGKREYRHARVMSLILDRIVRTDCGAWKCTSMVIWPKDKRVIAWKLLGLSQGRGQSVWALFGLVQEWIGSSRACGKSVPLQAHQGFLLHPETQRKPEKRESDCSIQDQEWLPLCPGNTLKWSGGKGEGGLHSQWHEQP